MKYIPHAVSGNYWSICLLGFVSTNNMVDGLSR